MTTLTIQEAQAQLEEIIHRLAPGDEVVITEMAIKFGLKKLYAAACPPRDSRHSAKLGFHDFQDRTLLARWIIDGDEDWDSSLD